MVNKNIRKKSWERVSAYGLPMNPNLPTLGQVRLERPCEEVVNRLLCLHVTAAVAYGFHNEQAVAWINQEYLNNCIDDFEKEFIHNGKGNKYRFRIQIEGIWTLAWSLNIVSKLDFNLNCPNNFVKMLPDLKKLESTREFRSNLKLRNEEEVITELDFVYCLHWAVRQNELTQKSVIIKSKPYVIPERRRALEWLISKENWYHVSLDT